MRTASASAFATTLAALLAACGQMPSRPGAMAPAPMASMAFSQDALPDAVKVPAGHKVTMETVGVGEITYECRAKANAAGAYEWVFVGPMAELRNRGGSAVGRYWGPPATWASSDGSAITGTQVAIAPAAAGSIPLQLVKANPATGQGAMTGVAYIQRVATQGGVAPASACDANGLGRKESVKYRADYIFWKAA